MQNIRLTENFWLHEFLKSDTADRMGISNDPSPEHLVNLTYLAATLAQPIRENFGRPVIITSGYRSPALNDAIDGSKTSQHSLGQAMDFHILGHSVKEVCEWIVYESQLDYDQLIYEKRWDATQWVHLSRKNDGENRKQVLSATVASNGNAEYVAGIR